LEEEKMSWLSDRFEGERILDLGSGHKAKFYTSDKSGDVAVGLLILHPKGPIHNGAYEDIPECMGGITFNIPEAANLTGPKWDLVSLDPIHVEPSVLCDCGDHGWIRNGKWVLG
jgi:hypothetical protein